MLPAALAPGWQPCYHTGSRKMIFGTKRQTNERTNGCRVRTMLIVNKYPQII